MDLVTLITEWAKLGLDLIHYLAWPAVALIVIFMFRSQIKTLSQRLKRVSKEDLNVDFISSDIQKQITELSDFRDATPDNFGGWEAYLSVVKSWGLWVYLYCFYLAKVSAFESLSKNDSMTLEIGRISLGQIADLLERQEPGSELIKKFRGFGKAVVDFFNRSAGP